MNSGYRRLTPEEALEIVKKEQRGKLKIFLGYAPGVGKTYAMLNEGNRRLKRGQDVVIGYVETHGRKDTEAQIGNLEIIPRKKIEYQGMILEEMDVDAIIARKPEVVLVDELAHTNAPGSKHKKRYEDVQEILDHGINVLTTLNIQHIESLNDIIQQITGVAVRETVPDSIIDNADEIVAVDLTPQALINRLKRGDIYPLSKLDECLANFFRKGNLSALRELMLRLTAEEVDLELEEYMKEHGIEDTWETNEKIMVCITPNPLSKKLIRRGARRARRFKCDWVVVYVDCTHFLAPKLTEEDKEVLESHFMLAKQLGAEVYTLRGKSVSDELLKFAKKMHITQIIIGHSQRSWLQNLFRGSTVIKLIKKAKNIEIHVIPYTK
jgi:two-component system sensor histidine kinase KdpD